MMNNHSKISAVASQRIKILFERKDISHAQRLALAVDPYGELDENSRAKKIAEAVTLASESRKRVHYILKNTCININSKLSAMNPSDKLLLLHDLSAALKSRMQDSPKFRVSDALIKQLENLDQALKSENLQDFAQQIEDDTITEIFAKLTMYDTFCEQYEAANSSQQTVWASAVLDNTDDSYCEVSELASAVILKLRTENPDLAKLDTQSASDLVHLGMSADIISARGAVCGWSFETLEGVLLSIGNGIFNILLAALLSEMGEPMFAGIMAVFAVVSLGEAITTAYSATFPAGILETRAGAALRVTAHDLKRKLGEFMMMLLDGITALVSRLCNFTTGREYAEEKNSEQHTVPMLQMAKAHA